MHSHTVEPAGSWQDLAAEPGILVCALYVLGVLVVFGVMAVMAALVS